MATPTRNSIFGAGTFNDIFEADFCKYYSDDLKDLVRIQTTLSIFYTLQTFGFCNCPKHHNVFILP